MVSQKGRTDTGDRVLQDLAHDQSSSLILTKRRKHYEKKYYYSIHTVDRVYDSIASFELCYSPYKE